MQLTKPTLLVNLEQVERHIFTMVKKAEKSHAKLRPHFKTHQSATIGNLFKKQGITQATVSSVDMAAYFIEHGWDDITIAFPYNPLEAGEISLLAQRCQLNVVIVSLEALEHLTKHVSEPLSFYLKIDVGTHRTGIAPGDMETLKRIGSCKTHHQLKGLLCHAGHSYRELNQSDASQIYQKSVADMQAVRKLLNRPELLLSYGDTPTCSLLDDFSEVDELRPGNFVFYDVMQHAFGVCSLADIAVCLACPVVAIHPERNEVVVYGGAVHLSKDKTQYPNQAVYGQVVAMHPTGWGDEPIGFVHRLSQEHGIIRMSDKMIKQIHIGDILGILPVHSCLTADLQPYYISLAGHKIEKLAKS